MPTSARSALRYPASSDSPDVPRDLGFLAADADLLTARLLSAAALQKGVVGAASLKVTPGAALSISVASGLAILPDDATAFTLTPVYQAAATVVNLNAAHATLPRLDQVYKTLSGSLVYVPGTATSGATLDNRTGSNDAGAPASSVRIADILVPAASTTVAAGNIRDRRPWARGAFRRIMRTAGDYSTTSTTAVEIDSVNLKPRIECSGAPLRIRLVAGGVFTTANSGVIIFFGIDGLIGTNGIPAGDGALVGTQINHAGPVQNLQMDFSWELDWIPPPGSHTFAPQWVAGASQTITMYARTTIPTFLTIEEIVRQDAENS